MKNSRSHKNRINGLCSGFAFIGNLLEKYYPEYSFYYMSDSSSSFEGVIRNYKKFKDMDKSNELSKYDIITLSAWENIIYYKKKNSKQLLIAYPNGFIVGLNYDQTIKEVPLPKRLIHRLMKLFFDKKMQQMYKNADMLIVSTPNMIEHAKKLREDALWLPNPIDTKTFSPKGAKVKLEGNPSVFLPTRLHAFKNPLFGVNLFKKIKAKYPDAKLHMIRYGGGEDPLFNAFKQLVDLKDVVYHEKMPHYELCKYYRSANIVLGQFNDTLGNFSLVELEAMASGAALVTLDIYEINQEFGGLKNLEKLAFRLIEDKAFKKRFIKRNLDYVIRNHSEKAVAKIAKEYVDRGFEKIRKQGKK